MWESKEKPRLNRSVIEADILNEASFRLGDVITNLLYALLYTALAVVFIFIIFLSNQAPPIFSIIMAALPTALLVFIGVNLYLVIRDGIELMHYVSSRGGKYTVETDELCGYDTTEKLIQMNVWGWRMHLFNVFRYKKSYMFLFRKHGKCILPEHSFTLQDETKIAGTEMYDRWRNCGEAFCVVLSPKGRPLLAYPVEDINKEF